MTNDLDWDGAEARVALDADSEVVTWPPRIDARIHYNSGWSRTSWTAEVRAIVDDQVAVIWKTVPAFGRSRHALLDRVEVLVWGQQSRTLFYGPLPKELCVLEGENR